MEEPSEAIYVHREGVQSGPFTEKELRRHWANGVIHSEDWVWQEGMSDWIQLGSYFGVPVLVTSSTSVRDLVQVSSNPVSESSSGLGASISLAVPVILSILCLSWGLLQLWIMPDLMSLVYVALALGVIFALWAVLLGRKPMLFLLLAVHLCVPVLLWHFFDKTDSLQPTQEETVEQQGENPPVSNGQKVVSQNF
ncbi:MAG: DUF4339 domain-containing protein [Blastochloris sp.]|nr:DUF4339 domain-containing protein [Blastochloris sp.]